MQRRANTKVHDKQGRTPLHAAACLGDVGMATSILEGGADIEAIDKVRGRTGEVEWEEGIN